MGAALVGMVLAALVGVCRAGLRTEPCSSGEGSVGGCSVGCGVVRGAVPWAVLTAVGPCLELAALSCMCAAMLIEWASNSDKHGL